MSNLCEFIAEKLNLVSPSMGDCGYIGMVPSLDVVTHAIDDSSKDSASFGWIYNALESIAAITFEVESVNNYLKHCGENEVHLIIERDVDEDINIDINNLNRFCNLDDERFKVCSYKLSNPVTNEYILYENEHGCDRFIPCKKVLEPNKVNNFTDKISKIDIWNEFYQLLGMLDPSDHLNDIINFVCKNKDYELIVEIEEIVEISKNNESKKIEPSISDVELLIKAAKNSDYKEAKRLLDLGIDPSEIIQLDYASTSAGIVAIEQNDEKMFSLFLDSGLYLNTTHKYGNNWLNIAVEYGNEAIIENVYQRIDSSWLNKTISTGDGKFNPLLMAIELNKLQLFFRFLNDGMAFQSEKFGVFHDILKELSERIDSSCEIEKTYNYLLRNCKNIGGAYSAVGSSLSVKRWSYLKPVLAENIHFLPFVDISKVILESIFSYNGTFEDLKYFYDTYKNEVGAYEEKVPEAIVNTIYSAVAQIAHCSKKYCGDDHIQINGSKSKNCKEAESFFIEAHQWILENNFLDVEVKLNLAGHALKYPKLIFLLEELIEKGACVNSHDDGTAGDLKLQYAYDRTPLMAAAGHGNLDAVKLLVQHDADIDGMDEYGLTCFDYAKILRKKKVTEYFDELILGHSQSSDI